MVEEYATDSKLHNPEVMILVRCREQITGKRVLDIGCGAGRTTALLRHLAARYVGMDVSEETLRACKRRFPQESLIRCDARDLGPFRDGAFDFALFAMNGLDYLSHEGRLKALGEARRVLAAGGLFAFSSHNRRYRHAARGPRFQPCANPFTLAKNLARFGAETSRHRRNKRLESSTPEYAILNDLAHGCRLLTYYIARQEQERQARKAGFEIISAYDTDGSPLPAGADDSESCWIYYVARKTG